MYLVKEWFSPKLQILVAVLVLVSIYTLMIPFYRLYDFDDAWTLSFVYHYWQYGDEFGQISGKGVVAYFGKTQAFIYGLWSEIWGWGRLPMRALSAILVVIGALLWGTIVWHFTRNKSFVISTIILCLLLDIFVDRAASTRPDALVYMLSALATLLACKRKWFLAGFIISLAIETHPASIFGFAIVISVWFNEKSRFDGAYIKQYLPRLIAGGMLGIVYYLSLHFEHLQDLVAHIQAASNVGLHRSSLYLHFFEARYYRHLPNLLIFIIAYGLFYWKCNRNSQFGRFLHYATLAILIADLVTGRGNAAYAIHAYPIFVLVLLTVWQHLSKPRSWLIAGFFCLMAPQYGYMVAKWHDFYFPTYISLIKQHIQPNTVHIGRFMHWFAFNDNQKNYFYVPGQVGKSFDASGKRFIWIRDNVWVTVNGKPTREFGQLTPQKLKQRIPKELKQPTQECSMELLSSFMYAGHTIRFEQYDCRKSASHQHE